VKQRRIRWGSTDFSVPGNGFSVPGNTARLFRRHFLTLDSSPGVAQSQRRVGSRWSRWSMNSFAKGILCKVDEKP
jgi:hypothetical protein